MKKKEYGHVVATAVTGVMIVRIDTNRYTKTSAQKLAKRPLHRRDASTVRDGDDGPPSVAIFETARQQANDKNSKKVPQKDLDQPRLVSVPGHKEKLTTLDGKRSHSYSQLKVL
jgi:hypothetical protein